MTSWTFSSQISGFDFFKMVLRNTLLGASALLAFSTQAVNFTPLPPYLTEIKGAPMVMLNLSRDHQLFFKAYNEYSDLNNDGLVETQYLHSYRYYGYFDNQRCYTYSTADNRYTPTRKVNASDSYCGGTGEWSGNFMNWATMTRMDVVRRILYGGFRSTDNSVVSGASLTVLERAHLPTDAHAFAKYYAGADIDKLTPFTGKTQLTMCNASFKNDKYSHNNISAPSILVTEGNFSLWNANERWQCYWSEDKSASNGNNPAVTGYPAAGSNPSRTANGLGTGYAQGSYTARVEVCKGLPEDFTDDEKSRCKLYPLGNYKPVGLLQRYGEKNEAAFGLLTGSFNKNVSGGVLRKNVASFTDEVDLDDGQFKNVDGIVRTLNRLRIYGYNYDAGHYLDDGAGCNYQQIGLIDGECASWGNPMGEMYLESLRYLAGKTPSSDYIPANMGKDTALGLTISAWTDPFRAETVPDFGDQLCRKSSILNFNASVTSFDQNSWTGASDIAGLTPALVDDYTNLIGSAEGLYANGKLWSVGRTGSDNNGFCSDKTLAASGTNSLANATGVCPEAPTQYGGYKVAGAALYSHTNRIRTDFNAAGNASNTRAFKVDTYSVALATGTPRIKVPVPGQPGKFVFISPAYRLSVGGGGGGTLVDFKVISQTPTTGRYLVNWEDSEQGGDFDQDVLGILEYNVVGSTIRITTSVLAEATVNAQGFGYAISGTGADGVHFHSGIRGFNYTDSRNITTTPATNVNASGGCNNCQLGQAATTASYAMAGVSAESLKDPLWYAAKYGGFDTKEALGYTPGATLPVAAWDSKAADGSTGADGTPDNFFLAVDPAELEKSLDQVFSQILKAGGAAPAAATSSRTQVANYVFKAAGGTSDADASGEFLRYGFQSNGKVALNPDWDAGTKLTTQNWDTGRIILTGGNTSGVPFRWSNLTTTQKDALKRNPQTGALDSDAIGQKRLNWLRGESTNETVVGGLRARPKTKLGAIMNSTPWYTGRPSAGYSDAEYGGGYSTFATDNSTTNAVFVAANDGMLHAFDGNSGGELFAYIPNAMYLAQPTTTAPYSKLSAITNKNYALNVGTGGVNMDGSVMTADMKVGAAPVWQTYLFGAFGRGAKGVYALNVTKPQDITETGASAAILAKWEFTGTSSNSSADNDDVGYIVGRTNSRSNGQPFQTGLMANNKWAAIYGNGYNSTSGKAALFILFSAGPTGTGGKWIPGTDYVKISVGTVGDGPNNGLSTPTALDTDNDGKIDRIYAGDLKGNVWRFDVSGANATSWKVGTTSNVPLFSATTINAGPPATTVAQPITTAIQAFAHPNGGLQLVFGTGKSLESTDYPMTAPFTNSVYGLRDTIGNITTITSGKTDLVEQDVSVVAKFRYVTKNDVDYATKKGWYIDLPESSEGVVFNPISEDTRRVLVRSLAPRGASDGCRVASNAFDMTLDVIRGSSIENAIPGAPLVTDLGAVGTVTEDSFEIAKNGLPVLKAKKEAIACVSGNPNNRVNPADPTQCEQCIPGEPCCPSWDTSPACRSQCQYLKNEIGGDGRPKTIEGLGSCTNGRLTWREVLRNR
jgi:type IV pilus assembly protein PilY1